MKMTDKNVMLPKAEVEQLQSIFKGVDVLIEKNERIDPSRGVKDSLNRVHTLLYMEYLNNFIKSAKELQGLLEIEDIELLFALTSKGESLLEVERNLTLNCLEQIMKKQMEG